MAEGDIRDTFHRTEIPELYDDLQSISYNTEHDPPLHNTELKGIPNFDPPPAPVSRGRQQMFGTTINPKPYDGKTNPRIWLNHYEAVAEANVWNNDLKLRRVIGSLDGAAQDWYMNFRISAENHPLSWGMFKNSLIRRFTNTLDDMMLTENIILDRQKGVDFDTYWEKKYGLIKLTSPGMSERELKAIMLLGLNKNLRTEVIRAMVTTPCESADDLKTLIKKITDVQLYQGEDSSQNQNRRVRYNSKVEVYEHPNGWNRRNYRQNSYRDIEKLSQEIRNLKTTLSQTRVKEPERHREENRTQFEKPRTLKKDIECFNCGKMGHYANECTESKSPNVQRRGFRNQFSKNDK